MKQLIRRVNRISNYVAFGLTVAWITALLSRDGGLSWVVLAFYLYQVGVSLRLVWPMLHGADDEVIGSAFSTLSPDSEAWRANLPRLEGWTEWTLQHNQGFYARTSRDIDGVLAMLTVVEGGLTSVSGTFSPLADDPYPVRSFRITRCGLLYDDIYEIARLIETAVGQRGGPQH